MRTVKAKLPIILAVLTAFLSGAAIVPAIGFTKSGWKTRSEVKKIVATKSQIAAEESRAAAKQEMVAMLATYCIQKSYADPNRYQIILDISAANADQREKIIEKAGWASLPGIDKPIEGLAAVCLTQISLY